MEFRREITLLWVGSVLDMLGLVGADANRRKRVKSSAKRRSKGWKHKLSTVFS